MGMREESAMACFVTGFLGKGEAGRGEQKTASRGPLPPRGKNAPGPLVYTTIGDT